MSKILLFMLPEPGHLLPTVPVAAELTARGHSVEYLTISEFRHFFVSRGFGFRPWLSPLIKGSTGVGSMFETHCAGRNIYAKLLADVNNNPDLLAPKIVEDLMMADSDLIILDSSIVCGLFTPKGQRELERIPCPVMRISPLFTDRYDSYPVPAILKSAPELVLCPKELDLPTAGPSPLNRRYVEPSVLGERYRDAPACTHDWNGRKMVYCSFGTQSSAYNGAASLLRRVVEAFERLPELQLIVAVGGHNPLDEFGNPPDNVLFVKSAPQLELLGRATLAITHGGLGSIKEAILCNTPMIVMPFVYDQPLNADRVVYHGLGMTLSASTCTSTEIRAAVSNLTSDASFAENVKSFKMRFERWEREKPSVHHIESFLLGEAGIQAGTSGQPLSL